MTTEPLYQLPLVEKTIPAYAAAKEDRLRAIRKAATAADRLEAYRQIVGVRDVA